MKMHAVLSVLGPDRVGVVDELAEALATRRLGIENSRMTALGGEFAVIAQVGGDESDVRQLQRDLHSLGKTLGFELRIQLEAAEPKSPEQDGREYLIESFSPGPVGIGALTGILKRHGVNIENLRTDAAPAPWTSEITFHMKACITVPASCALKRLREDLRELERNRDVDIVIRPPASNSCK